MCCLEIMSNLHNFRWDLLPLPMPILNKLRDICKMVTHKDACTGERQLSTWVMSSCCLYTMIGQFDVEQGCEENSCPIQWKEKNSPSVVEKYCTFTRQMWCEKIHSDFFLERMSHHNVIYSEEYFNIFSVIWNQFVSKSEITDTWAIIFFLQNGNIKLCWNLLENQAFPMRLHYADKFIFLKTSFDYNGEMWFSDVLTSMQHFWLTVYHIVL